MFFSQFLMLMVSQIAFASILFISSKYITDDSNRLFILRMVGLVLIIVNTRYMLIYVLQATNKIKCYAYITMMDRIVYIILIMILLLFGIREYKLMIVADLIGKVFSLVYAMYCCREIVFHKISIFYLSFSETIQNISVGIKLMFANIASILLIGVVRFGIERTWDVVTFGKVSLTLSISNMTMIFINAIGIIMFPILRRTDQSKLSDIYITMRDFLMIALLGLLMFYYPLRVIMSVWLPQYSESLMYMSLVFPMFIYEGKMALLINTYLKTLRKEKIMLKINLISVGLSLITTLVSTQLLMNLDFAVLSIVILLAFKSLLAEVYLSKMIKISIVKDMILELTLTISFIIFGWVIDSWYTVLFYGLVYLIYLIIKKKDIINSVYKIKLLMKA